MSVQRALRIWSVEGSIASVNGNLTGGAFQAGFAIYLGCNDFILGVLAAIPAFAGLLQLFSAVLVEKFGRRKPLVQWLSFIGRLIWVPIFLIPLGLLPKSLQIPGFLVFYIVSNLLLNIVGPLWISWISDLVPADSRGRYFGQRNIYAGFVGMVVCILGGYFLDASVKHHILTQPQAFGWLFGIAAVFGLFSFILCGMAPDVPVELEETPGTHGRASWAQTVEYYSRPFADPSFRSLIVFIASFIVAQSIAGQFFTINQLKYLKLNNTDFQLLAAVGTIASLGALPLIGYLADKYGNKPIMFLSCAIVIAPPFMWLLASPDGYAGLWKVLPGGHLLISYSKLDVALLNIIAGVGWAGVGLTQFNLMIGAAPQQFRTLYVSSVAAVSGIAGGIAPLIGGAFVSALSGVHFPDHGLVRNSYHVLFILSGVLRLAFLMQIASIVEHGSSSASYVLGQLKATKPVASIAGIHSLSHSKSAKKRQRAAASLGRLKTPIAVEELVLALDDVSLTVRETAAVALGEIGDRRAVTPLIEKMADPTTGISGAVATALGKIGDKEAFSVLAAAAQLGPPARKIAAIEALGRISDPRSSDLLVDLLEDGDSNIRTAAVNAITLRGDPRGEEALNRLLTEETEPTAIAAIADVLGRHGSTESAGPLVDALDEASSPTVRRTIVNALGSVVGGTDSFYPMLAMESSARDDMVTKMLSGLVKRYSGSGRMAKLEPAPRVAARARQAMDAYADADLTNCLSRLGSLAELIVSMQPAHGPSSIAFEVLQNITQRSASREEAPSVEEVLLALFLIKELLDRH